MTKKIILFSFVVLSLIIVSCSQDEGLEISEQNFQEELVLDDSLETRENCDPCNCGAIYSSFIIANQNCILFGTGCEVAQQLQASYQACRNKVPTCPPGFRWDGCNCYSGVHVDSRYETFTWRNGFYVKQNCEISTANDCCPPGFIFDGANCYLPSHHWNEEFPGFTWNNGTSTSFYTQPTCD